MSNKIVLVSEDANFFEFITTKLELRKTDELFSFSFENITEKLHLLDTSVVIINSENAQEKTLSLLSLLKRNPTIICAYNNDDENYRKKCYKSGAFDFMSILISDSEFRARMISAFSVASLMEKNKSYREILVKKEILNLNNEVYTNYSEIIDYQLTKIKEKPIKAVFLAISPSDKNKFLIQTNQIETILLNNIRLNDILMNYAPNKYFLILYNTDLKSAEKLWIKIQTQFSEKIYSGIVNITNQSRQQIINEALNKLHLAINNDKGIVNFNTTKISKPNAKEITTSYNNFKTYKKEFEKKIENVITPVFYQIQQKYTDKLVGITINHKIAEGGGQFIITDHSSICSFKITSPGFSKINIDITFQKNNDNIDAKRITIEPEELEAGILEDLLEQFVLEYKSEMYNF